MSRITRVFREGFLGVIRHFALSLSSISSVTVTLLLMAVFLLLSVNINSITHQLESSVQIHVQIDDQHETQEQIDAIRAQIEAIPSVSHITYSSKEEELETFIQINGDESDVAEKLYGPFRGDNNPLLNAFIVQTSTGESMNAVTEQIEAIDGIFNASHGGTATMLFVQTLGNVRNVGFVIVVALGFIAIFLISNTIRTSIHSRRREISIMRTVGATNWYIRWPFIIEGMVIGLIGSIIPILVTIFGYKYLFQFANGLIWNQVLTLVPVTPLVFEISGLLVMIGTVVGALGSLFSVGKFLRWSR